MSGMIGTDKWQKPSQLRVVIYGEAESRMLWLSPPVPLNNFINNSDKQAI